MVYVHNWLVGDWSLVSHGSNIHPSSVPCSHQTRHTTPYLGSRRCRICHRVTSEGGFVMLVRMVMLIRMVIMVMLVRMVCW